MDLKKMMKQAQEMQGRLQQMQEDLASLEVEGQAGGGLVKVKLNGKLEAQGLKIDPSLIKPEEAEILEDLIVAAFQDAIGDLKIKISGCINACGHHHVGHIGILGVEKRGEEHYQLLLGGSGAEDAALASITGPGFGPDGIVDAVEKVVATYLELRSSAHEPFLAAYTRLGPAPFKEALYA